MPETVVVSKASTPEGESRYLPVRLSSLRNDSITNFDIYVQLSPTEPLVLYRERNVPFSEEARQRLVDNHIDQVYITTKQRQAYAHYIEQHLPEILQDEGITVEEKSKILYTSAYGVVEDLMVTSDVGGCVERAKEVVKHTVSGILADQVQFAHLLEVISFDYHIYTHCVNVTAYSMALAQRAGYGDAATLRELANGALLHDVGKSKIDPAILNSSDKLTLDQWEVMERHPTYGYELLRDTNSLGEVALDVVLHHHEKMHGGGYPDNLEGAMISPFVRIVTICDIFDALTTTRSFQGARSSFDALNVMREEVDRDLDPDLFREFVTLMGQPGGQ